MLNSGILLAPDWEMQWGQLSAWLLLVSQLGVQRGVDSVHVLEGPATDQKKTKLVTVTEPKREKKPKLAPPSVQ